MSRTINFVRERQRNLSKIEVQDSKTLRWMSIATASLVALILIVVGIRLFFVYRLKAVTDNQKQLRAAIVSKEEVEKSFTIFAYKLKTLTDLFGKRREKQEALQYFSSLFGPEVIIRQLSYSGTTEVLSFTLESQNIFVLENVFKVMSSDEIKKRYPTIKKQSLRRSDDASYGMFITIALGDEKPPEVTGAPVSAPTDTVPAVK